MGKTFCWNEFLKLLSPLAQPCAARPVPVTCGLVVVTRSPQSAQMMVLMWSLLVTALTVVWAKKDYETKSFRGFYNDRICGTVFTDRCPDLSKRIVCGSDYCAELAPYHAVLDMKKRLGSRNRREGSLRVVDAGGPKQFLVKNKEGLYDYDIILLMTGQFWTRKVLVAWCHLCNLNFI